MVPEDIKKGVDAEQNMHLLDRKFLDLKESKNRLETVCYKYRDSLQGAMAPFLEDKAKEAVIVELTKTVDWLYGEGEDSTFDEYTKRYTEFMKVLEPVKKRSIYHDEIPSRFSLFESSKKNVNTRLESEELAHITEEQRKVIADKIAVVSEFMNGVQAELAKNPKHDDPATSVADVDAKLRILNAEVYPILNTPAPKAEEPKPEEEKKDDAKADVPMDNAGAEMPDLDDQPKK